MAYCEQIRMFYAVLWIRIQIRRIKTEETFLLVACKPLTKKAGSGSQWYGSVNLDPDP
jgi:hypothetical protein